MLFKRMAKKPGKKASKLFGKTGMKLLGFISGPISVAIIYFLPATKTGAIISAVIALITFFVFKPIVRPVWLLASIALIIWKLIKARSEQSRIDKRIQEHLDKMPQNNAQPQQPPYIPPNRSGIPPRNLEWERNGSGGRRGPRKPPTDGF